MSNYFYFDKKAEYPKDIFYRPESEYPEYPFKEMGFSEQKNDIYRMFRQLLYNLGLDKPNYGTKEWNPLGEYIKPGNTVLIKPNLVMHYNPTERNLKRGLECLTTHPSLIRCIIDYVIIALAGRGKIIVADAPVQDCDFRALISKGGYQNVEDFYKKCDNYNINFVDLRETVMEHSGNWIEQKKNKDIIYKSKVVNLGKHSYFSKKSFKGRLRVSNYDMKSINAFHKDDKQLYSISEACLEADVIISVPKPKTHRIAGYTGALKNFIGVNTRKEYLPHHQKGSMLHHGDECENNSFLAKIRSDLEDFKNSALKNRHYRIFNIINQINILTVNQMRNRTNNYYNIGMWHGNDTIWRTILDINRIVKYADKQGRIQKKPKRKLLSIGDMIVCGEKEGPMEPSYKKVGGILFSDNSVEFDLFQTKLMGFPFDVFPTLNQAIYDKILFRKNRRFRISL